MILRNEITGDTLEVPPPDYLGASCVLFNGKEVETCLYSDATNSVTTGKGIMFTPEGWSKYLQEQLRTGWGSRTRREEGQ